MGIFVAPKKGFPIILKSRTFRLKDPRPVSIRYLHNEFDDAILKSNEFANFQELLRNAFLEQFGNNLPGELATIDVLKKDNNIAQSKFEEEKEKISNLECSLSESIDLHFFLKQNVIRQFVFLFLLQQLNFLQNEAVFSSALFFPLIKIHFHNVFNVNDGYKLYNENALWDRRRYPQSGVFCGTKPFLSNPHNASNNEHNSICTSSRSNSPEPCQNKHNKVDISEEEKNIFLVPSAIESSNNGSEEIQTMRFFLLKKKITFFLSISCLRTTALNFFCCGGIGIVFRCVKCFILALTKEEICMHKAKWHGMRLKKLEIIKPIKKPKKIKTLSEYRCTECNKKLKTRALLRKHIRGVHVKPFSCPYEVCQALNKRFGEGRHLRAHIERFHLKVREICELCKKFYYDRQSLQKHLEDVHLKMRPYVCIVCQKCFTRSFFFIVANFKFFF
ncbi:C2H2 type domain containing protein [Reticulomyxa filosa]|uniref:C2H2 type domain containing protein n=1 Tax=Reticulomyxa filosa TaxID=46433 RepID=X6NXJ4_RETFI|nr:C2H2 type domain containing protein [Reticulomyxa filosa]|eukprot:ETO31030.1 C2H2 type domain containing protein [Reticulomyxa filosa]